MAENLKIEVSMVDVQSGVVDTTLATKEELVDAVKSKADLIEGKVPVAQLPGFSEINGVSEAISGVETKLRDEMATAMANNNNGLEYRIDEKLETKADLVNGRVPASQSPAFKDVEGAKGALDGLKEALTTKYDQKVKELSEGKADLVDGKVPTSQLPIDGIVTPLEFQLKSQELDTKFSNLEDSVEAEKNAFITQAGNLIAGKANAVDVYDKVVVDNKLGGKVDKSKYDLEIVKKAEQTYVDAGLTAVTAGHKAYTTLTLAQAAQASLPANTIVEVTNDPTASNNGTYQWNGTTLTKSAYDPLTQAKNYADANPLFNPVALTTVNNVDELVSNGLYTAPTTNIAQAVGFPFGTSGQLLVTTSANYVLQTYYLDTGEVFQRRKTVSGWSELKGQLVRTLTGTDKLNDYTKSGIFQCVSNNHATETNNYPFSARGILFVQTNGITVTQHYLSLSGLASRAYRNDQPEVGWEAWRGVTFPSGITNLNNLAYKGENISRRIDSMSALNGHLDNATTSGCWQTIVRSIATTENGFPITDTVGLLEVSSDGNLVLTQTWQTYKGTAYRYGSYNSQSVLTWQPWRGYINSDNGLTDITNAIVVGKSPIKRISALSEIGTHLDDVRTTGMWHTTLRSIATTENGFPITDVIGVIEVSASGTQAVTQYWRSYKGLAVRWGSYNAQGVLTWQPWRGYLLSESGITQLGESATTTTQTQLITFGSSTLWYLEDELQSLATLKNLHLRPNAKSGYTLGAAGLNQGTNKMTVQFDSGVIATGANAVIIESSFNDDIRAAMTVELSNGVKGSLNYRDKTFTPSNLTTSLTVSSTEKYKVTVPLWNDINAQGGIFIFNIGKNSVSSSVDNSDYIVEKTVEMIEAIPVGSKFIVGGHFSNWVGTTTETHHTVVHSVNQKLRLKYGLKYFDIAELFGLESTWTTLGLTKTADDIAAIAANRMPPSLSRDAAHMSAGMDLILSKVIEDKLVFLGYIRKI